MLEAITVDNFRCITAANLALDERATGIIGANASGKTSLLEAIYCLAHGRSFRGAVRADLVRRGAKSTRIVATLSDSHRTVVAGVEFDASGSSETRLNAQSAPAWQFAQAIPTQIIDPSVHRLLEEGSLRRRRLMDWGVFHVKPLFIDEWRRYQRALAQRNAALKAGASAANLGAWTEALVTHSHAVHASRSQYIEQLIPSFRLVSADLLGEPAELFYRRGWNDGLQLLEAVNQSRGRELRQKTTVVGPHRADLDIRWGDASARQRVSRGQQKLLAAALILAQIELRSRTAASPVCLMLDDPAAELDVDNLGKLLKAVAGIPAQLILTSLEEVRFNGIQLGRTFHVEQGRFRQVI